MYPCINNQQATHFSGIRGLHMNRDFKMHGFVTYLKGCLKIFWNLQQQFSCWFATYKESHPDPPRKGKVSKRNHPPPPGEGSFLALLGLSNQQNSTEFLNTICQSHFLGGYPRVNFSSHSHFLPGFKGTLRLEPWTTGGCQGIPQGPGWSRSVDSTLHRGALVSDPDVVRLIRTCQYMAI